MRPFFLISVLIFFIDRVLKLFVFRNFSQGSSFPIFKNILHITPICNSGVAFGLFKGLNLYVLVAASLVVSIIIIYMIFVKKPTSPMLILALFLILSGALSNLTDRIFYGCVLDFIDLRVWPVFNVADSAITIGAILMLVYMFNTRSRTED